MVNQFLVIAISSGVIAFVVTPLTLVVARQIRFLSFPRANRWHRVPVPLMGGIALWLAFIISLLAFGRETDLVELVAVVVGSTVIMVVGLIDDLRGLSPRLKTLGILLAAGILIAGGLRTSLFPWLIVDVGLTLFWVYGITNALNLMDNMDGMAAGVAAAASLAFLLIAAVTGQTLVATLAAALLGACMGFLVYNFQPALTFMGDTGALMLGFALAILGIKLSFTGITNQLTWMIPVLVLAVPIFDTTLVTVSRIRRGVPVSRGGTDHTSHRLARLGLSHRRVALVLSTLTFAFGLLAILLLQTEVWLANTVAVGLGLLGIFTIYVFERVGAMPASTALKPGLHITVIGGGPLLPVLVDAAFLIAPDVTVVLAPRPDNATPDVREVSPRLLRELWAVMARGRGAVTTILETSAELFEVGSLAERVRLATDGLQLLGQVALGELDEHGQAGVSAQVARAIYGADMVLIGGNLSENVLAVLAASDARLALRTIHKPRVLIHDHPESALAQLETTGVGACISHVIAPDGDFEHLVLLDDLADSVQLAEALSEVWVQRARVPALNGLNGTKARAV